MHREHAAALHQFSRLLDRDPLSLLLVLGRTPADFFASLQDPDHPSLGDYYRPPEHTALPTVNAQNAYERGEFEPPSDLPPLPGVLPKASTPLAPPTRFGRIDPAALRLLAADTADRANQLFLDTPLNWRAG